MELGWKNTWIPWCADCISCFFPSFLDMFVCYFITPSLIDHGLIICINWRFSVSFLFLHFSHSCFGLIWGTDGVKGVSHMCAFSSYLRLPCFCFHGRGCACLRCLRVSSWIELNSVKYGKLLFGTDAGFVSGREGTCESPLLIDRCKCNWSAGRGSETEGRWIESR